MECSYCENFAKTLLIDPISADINRLAIITNQASPNMASWLLNYYDEKKIKNINVELFIASSYSCGVDFIDHNLFRGLHNSRTDKNNTMSCSYLHEKMELDNNIYLWFNGNILLKAYTSSLDFTQSSILRSDKGKIEAVPLAIASLLYNDAINKSIYCNHNEIEEYIAIYKNSLASYSPIDSCNVDSVTLSFLTKTTGQPGLKSGLNWGQRKKRNPNEAYIPLPSSIAKSGFFPLNKQHFLVVTDDHHMLQLRVEQQNDKAITTPTSNALLGEYFRNRMSLSNGIFITRELLLEYGRTDVTFYKIDEEQYYMDFSVIK